MDGIIVKMLIDLKLESLLDHFRYQNIDFETLNELTDEEMRELIPNLGNRKKIKNI